MPHTWGNVTVTADDDVHATESRLAKFLNDEGFTAAQYKLAKDACIKRVKGESMTPGEEILADRFQALGALIAANPFEVT